MVLWKKKRAIGGSWISTRPLSSVTFSTLNIYSEPSLLWWFL